MSLMSKIIKLCRVSRTDPDQGLVPVQEVNFESETKVSNSLAWYPYGFHAVAREDTLSMMFSRQGDVHSHIPSSYQKRILVADGEVIVYHPDNKSKVHFRENGDIDIDSPTANVNIHAAVNVNVDADVDINLTAVGDVNVNGTDVVVAGTNSVALSAPTATIVTPSLSITADTSIEITTPSTTIGDGSNDIIALMVEMCLLVRDSETDHNGDRPMTNDTVTAWNTLAAKVGTLA